jgi:hypothetical protein
VVAVGGWVGGWVVVVVVVVCASVDRKNVQFCSFAPLSTFVLPK